MLRRADRLREQDEHRHGPGCDHEGTGREEARPVQRSTVHDVLRRAGRPLDEATRTDMEARLGADFSDVRIHDDASARASAAEVGARAYTSGSHVVLGRGGTDKHTLAHELTHVIQQRQGPVAGADDGSGLKVSDPSDRFEREAEANATRVMRAGARTPAAEGSAPQPARPTAGGGESIQRVKSCTCNDPYCMNGERCSYATPSYMLGQHGNKTKEQARLSSLYNTTVNGSTHQSEHLFGYRVLQGDSTLTRGRSADARTLENNALAYQELHAAHRAHPGTGTSSQVGPSGFNADSYRHDTHSLLAAHQAGAAGQLNTLGYMHNQNGQLLNPNDPNVQATNDSHLQMIYAQAQRGVDMAANVNGQNVIQNVPFTWEELLEQRTAHLMRSMSRQDAEYQARTELGPYYY
ncbi:DUF4157 domain-containing protein [Streptomyces sp. NPDC013181]|uniref:eCIS core domain-containing protein n=1 Tax=Streptomyces sp. NPDC013181 TaxID=3364864 RepID=UPI00368D1A62